MPEYKGVAKFFAFLSRPEVQAWWHQTTGYLPITRAAYELTRAQGFYGRHPGADIAIKQMTLNPPTDDTRGLRLGSFVLIRDIIEETVSSRRFPGHSLPRRRSATRYGGETTCCGNSRRRTDSPAAG